MCGRKEVVVKMIMMMMMMIMVMIMIMMMMMMIAIMIMIVIMIMIMMMMIMIKMISDDNDNDDDDDDDNDNDSNNDFYRYANDGHIFVMYRYRSRESWVRAMFCMPLLLCVIYSSTQFPSASLASLSLHWFLLVSFRFFRVTLHFVLFLNNRTLLSSFAFQNHRTFLLRSPCVFKTDFRLSTAARSSWQCPNPLRFGCIL